MVTYLFIVNLSITNTNGDSLVKFRANLMIDLLDGTWNNTSLLVIIGQSQHGESLSRSGLAIAHDSSIVASNYI